MLERDDDGRYSNTPATELFLDPAKPSYIGGMLEMVNARLYRFWGSLTEGLRTGQPQSEVKTGGDFFETLYADPERLAQFAGAMSGLSAATGAGDRGEVPVARLHQRDRHRLRRGRCPGRDRPGARARDRRRLRPAAHRADLRRLRRPTRARPIACSFTPATFSPTRCRAPTCSSWATSFTTGTSTRSACCCRRPTTRYPTAGALIVYEAIIDDDRRDTTRLGF